MDILKSFPEAKFYLSPTYKIGDKKIAFEKMTQTELENNLASFSVFYSIGDDYFAGVAIKSETDFKYVKEIYGISPTYIIDKNIYLFVFKDFVTQENYKNIIKILEYIYEGEFLEAIPYEDTYKFPDVSKVEYVLNDKNKIDTNSILGLLTFIERITSLNVLNINGFDTDNYEEYIKTQVFNLEEIVEKLGVTSAKIDIQKNIIIDFKNGNIGDPFFFVLGNKVNKLEETLKWFNVNLGTDFKFKDSDKQVDYGKEGIEIIKGEDFNSNSLGYIILTAKGNPKQITDFFVKVYYKIIKADGSIQFIVKLQNPCSGCETSEIIWKNTNNITALRDFISSFGDFHFLGSTDDILKIHKAISLCDAKEINSVCGLGFFKDKLILKNGVFDYKRKDLVYNEGHRFYFDSDGNGFVLTHSNGGYLFDQLDYSFPNFYEKQTCIKTEKIWELFGSLYEGDLGLLMLMYLWGLIGYGMFGDTEKYKYLGFNTQGFRGSGKTEYHNLAARVFGMQTKSIEFPKVTLFSITTLGSHLNKLPLLFGEYRENGINDLNNRQGKLRTMFDKGIDSKGRPDGSNVIYRYMANPMVEGEEKITDSATKTRFLQVVIQKSFQKNNTDFLNKINNSEEIQNLLYSYLMSVDNHITDYVSFINKGMEIFIGGDARTCQGFSLIYAGCMIYAPQFEKDIKKILIKYFEYNVGELENSSGHKEFFKQLGRNMSRIYQGYYLIPAKIGEKAKINFDIGAIEEFFRTKRVPLSLGFNTYIDQLDKIGYKICYGETESGFKEVLSIDIDEKYPIELLGDTQVYSEWKKITTKK